MLKIACADGDLGPPVALEATEKVYANDAHRIIANHCLNTVGIAI